LVCMVSGIFISCRPLVAIPIRKFRFPGNSGKVYNTCPEFRFIQLNMVNFLHINGEIPCHHIILMCFFTSVFSLLKASVCLYDFFAAWPADLYAISAWVLFTCSPSPAELWRVLALPDCLPPDVLAGLAFQRCALLMIVLSACVSCLLEYQPAPELQYRHIRG
jgi:hypothetical protein